MMRTSACMNVKSSSAQHGATLIVAVILLLIITLLGISSLRGITLESRITANLKQEKLLFNAAEAGLRLGEASFDSPYFNAVPDSGLPCTTTPYIQCLPYSLSNLQTPALPDGTTFFTDATKVIKANSSTEQYASSIEWYAVDLGCLGFSQDNGAATGQCSPRYYEVDSCASVSGTYCTDNTTSPRIIVRSVYAKNF